MSSKWRENKLRVEEASKTIAQLEVEQAEVHTYDYTRVSVAGYLATKNLTFEVFEGFYLFFGTILLG